MTKVSKIAFIGLMEGKPAKGSKSIWTDGKHLYSYNTCVGVFVSGGWLIACNGEHSITTTKRCNEVASALKDAKKAVLRVNKSVIYVAKRQVDNEK